ncbi:hypothetical protein ACSMDF_04725 [Yersinia enterocolitica]
MHTQLVITNTNGTALTEDGIYQVVISQEKECFIYDDEGAKHEVRELIVAGVSFIIEPLE